jgi:phage gpG-like protein
MVGEAVRIVVTDNMGEVQNAIEARLEGVSDFSAFWEQLRAPWEKSRREMYASNGRSTDTPWTKYTRAERRRYVPFKARVLNRSVKGMNDTLLRWGPGTGRLQPSLENTRHPYAIWRGTSEALTLGTSAPGAASHEYGGARAKEWMGGYKIPKRRILAFGGSFVRDVSVELGKFAATAGARRAGFSTTELMSLLRRGR